MRSSLLIPLALILSLQIALISTQIPNADSYLGTWTKLTIYISNGGSCCIPSAVNIWSESSNTLKMSFETYSADSPNYSSKCYYWSGSYALYPNTDKPGEYYFQKRDFSYFSTRNYHLSIHNGTSLLFQAGNTTGDSTAYNDCLFTMSTHGSLGSNSGTSWGFILLIVAIIALVGWKKYQKKQQEAIVKQNPPAQPSANPAPVNNFAQQPVYMAPQMYGYPNQQFMPVYAQPPMGYVPAQPQSQAGVTGQVNQAANPQANPQVAVNVNANAAQRPNEFDPSRFKPENGGIAVNPI